MTDDRGHIVDLLRADFEDEAKAGFPRLRRVPQTKVIQFLDYFDDLGPQHRASLLDDLARRASVVVNPGRGMRFPQAPAFDRYWNTLNGPGPYTGGYRYIDVKFLASVPRLREFGSHEGWIEKTQRPWVSERALQPREDLLPDLSHLRPAKASRLRRLVKATVQEMGFAAQKTRGAEHKYIHASGAIVRADFGSYVGQLRYSVSAACGECSVVMLSYETLWSQPGGWDYLTEENAERSVAFLPELVEYLMRLPERVQEAGEDRTLLEA
jgi:hypothetical protein